jgi:tetratricopeptide (TPR) repeat protein
MLGAFAVGLNLYAAALASPFVFDDFTLPVGDPPQNLWAAVTGLRPFLMLTYWLNSSMSGNSTLGYHVFNLIIHAVNTGLVFLVLARLLAMSGSVNTRNIRIASVLGAAIFFIHPLQTESVSYVAGRSESLAAFFILLAYAVFLYRRHEAISWLETAIVLTLFGLGVSTKENAVCLVGMLVLTDVFWPRAFSTRGLRNNRKLYSAMAVGAALAAWKVLGVLAAAPSAGFSIHEATWYQYGFTQARAFFTYMRLAAIPIGLSIDHDFPVSHTILEHGAIVYLAALAGLLAACYALRRRYPLACFGLLLTLIILAPTSSIVPIRDPLAERRMYLPLVGLILIGYDVARHVRIPRRTGYAVCGVILAGFYILCYQRNLLWAEPAQLFVEAAPESTTGRAYVNLVKVLAEEHRCSAAVPYLRQAEARLPNNYMVELAWGRALECMGQPAQALNKMLRAARIWPSSDVYTLIGCLYGELGRQAQAGIALRKAVALDSRSDSARSALETWIKWTSQNPPIDHQRSPP